MLSRESSGFPQHSSSLLSWALGPEIVCFSCIAQHVRFFKWEFLTEFLIVTVVQYRCIHLFHTNITPSIRIEDFGILNVCMKITFLSIAFTSISNSFYAAIIYTIVVLKKLLLIFKECTSRTRIECFGRLSLRSVTFERIFVIKEKAVTKARVGHSRMNYMYVPIQGFPLYRHATDLLHPSASCFSFLSVRSFISFLLIAINSPGETNEVKGTEGIGIVCPAPTCSFNDLIISLQCAL